RRGGQAGAALGAGATAPSPVRYVLGEQPLPHLDHRGQLVGDALLLGHHVLDLGASTGWPGQRRREVGGPVWRARTPEGGPRPFERDAARARRTVAGPPGVTHALPRSAAGAHPCGWRVSHPIVASLTCIRKCQCMSICTCNSL